MVIADRSLQATRFIVIDFETVTPAGRRPEPTEVAALALRVHDNQLIPAARYETLIRPPDDVPITSFDTAQTGITTQMLAGAPTAGQALNALDAKLTDPPYALVAHNASYEAGLIFDQRDHCPRLARTPLLDTVRLARCAYPDLARHRLDSILTHLGIPTPPDRHRAMPDVEATAQVFTRLIADGAEAGQWATLADLNAIGGLKPKATVIDEEAQRPTQRSLFT